MGDTQRVCEFCRLAGRAYPSSLGRHFLLHPRVLCCSSQAHDDAIASFLFQPFVLTCRSCELQNHSNLVLVFAAWFSQYLHMWGAKQGGWRYFRCDAACLITLLHIFSPPGSRNYFEGGAHYVAALWAAPWLLVALICLVRSSLLCVDTPKQDLTWPGWLFCR